MPTICSAYRLKNLLQLHNSPTLFRSFRRQMYDIAEKHLDVKHVAFRQSHQLNALKTELRSAFPDIFQRHEDSEIYLKLAMDMMSAYHSRRRFALKHQNQPAIKKRKLVMSVDVLTSRAAMKKKREEEKKRGKEDIIDLTGDDDRYQKVEPKLSQMADITNKIRKCSIPYREGLKSAVLQGQGSHQDGVPQSTDVARVTRFLNACSPSMAHLLQYFIDFGCTSEKYLVTVSTWPPAKISYFLNQISHSKVDGRNFSDSEMLALQSRFISYISIKGRLDVAE